MARAFDPQGMMRPFGAFSQAAWQPPGQVLQISGQVSVDGEGNVVAPGDMGAQTRRTLENIGTVLAHAGGGFDDVVSVIGYGTELSELGAIREVRRDF